jgi:anti-sigma-K factor RskA
MKRKTNIELNQMVDKWIDDFNHMPEQKASNDFVEKVMVRIEQQKDKEIKPLIREVYFWRSIAASLIVLIAVNIFTLIKIQKQPLNGSTAIYQISEEDNQLLDNGMIENFSLLAQEENTLTYEYE